MAKITMKGRAELRKKLRELPLVAREEIRKALAQSAEEIADFARRICPVDSGDLRASIGWTFGNAPKGTMVLAQSQANTEDELFVTIYAGNNQAFYARWVEFGTSKMSPRPFFFPAYRAVRRRVRTRISRAHTRAAKKVAATTK